MRRVKTEDYKTIGEWFAARGRTVEDWAYSSHGYIVEEVASGFLYRTDSGISFLDCYVANPKANQVTIHDAFRGITEKLTDDARSLGSKLLCCSTRIFTIKNLSIELGFHKIGTHDAFAKRL